jgi:3-methyladenine DNA glycosylase Tag
VSELPRSIWGFRFVGPTTAHAAMEACGIVNDHLAGCPVRAEVERERREAIRILG